MNPELMALLGLNDMGMQPDMQQLGAAIAGDPEGAAAALGSAGVGPAEVMSVGNPMGGPYLGRRPSMMGGASAGSGMGVPVMPPVGGPPAISGGTLPRLAPGLPEGGVMPGAPGTMPGSVAGGIMPLLFDPPVGGSPGAPPAIGAPPGPPLDITPPGAGAPPPAIGDPRARGGLLEALKGVKAPPAPAPLRAGTPAAPRANPMRAGELFAMLQALGGGAGGVGQIPGLGSVIR